MICPICDQELVPSTNLFVCDRLECSSADLDHFYSVEAEFLHKLAIVKQTTFYVNYDYGYVVRIHNYDEIDDLIEISQGTPEKDSQQVHNLKTIFKGKAIFNITKNIIEEVQNLLLMI